MALCVAISAMAKDGFTPLEQQQISIETPGLFDKSDAFTVDFDMLADKDYSFPLPVGKAKLLKDNMVEISTKKGDAVKAMFAGKVRMSKHHAQYGHVVVIRHDNGLETVYACNAQNLVKVGDRVKAGQTIAIVGGDYRFNVSYEFTGLNEVKPEMIEEATRNARAAAEKFAKDSDSSLGKIRNASQGQFSITNRDENTPYIKTVRVVTTINYYLKR